MAYDKDYKTGINSERETPDDLFNLLDREFTFVFDAAATHSNTKCALYIDKEYDSLHFDWGRYIILGGSIWLNPPYTRGVINKFVKKARFYATQGTTVVCLLPARTSAKWWCKHVVGWDGAPEAHAEIRFLTPRIKFLMNGLPMKGGAMTPNAVVIFTKGTGVDVHWWDWKKAIELQK